MLTDNITHELKVWNHYFDDVESGLKSFESRKNDRPFKVGDTLRLREYDPKTDKYSGREIKKKIAYILGDNNAGIETGHVILGLALPSTPLEDELLECIQRINGICGLYMTTHSGNIPKFGEQIFTLTSDLLARREEKMDGFPIDNSGTKPTENTFDADCLKDPKDIK